MTVVYQYPLRTDFVGVRSLQANGTNPSGNSAPSGNGPQICIVDGWARMKAWDTDAPFAGNIRSEITGYDDTVPSERLYRWESRFEKWPLNGPSFVTMQMHANHDGAAYAENVLMYFDGKELSLNLPATEPPNTGTTSKQVAAIPIAMGNIYKHALLINWDKTGNGSICWIVNGQVIFNATKIGTEYNYVVGPYLKLGVYNTSGATGWGEREQYVRDVIVTDGLEGKSWTELIGDIPRPIPFVVTT